MIQVTVSGPFVEPEHGSYVVLLNELDGDRCLPIWIGPTEAHAIAYELAGVKPKGPLVHDLTSHILQELGARVTRIAVVKLVEKIYYAELLLETDSVVLKVDARPSDSIVLALKMGAPIFVAEQVMGKRTEGAEGPQEADKLKAKLKRIRPEDFGSPAL